MIKAAFYYEKPLSKKANEAADKAAKFVAENGYIPNVSYWNIPEIEKEAESYTNEARSKLNNLAKKAGFKIIDKPDVNMDIFSYYEECAPEVLIEDRKHILTAQYEIKYKTSDDKTSTNKG